MDFRLSKPEHLHQPLSKSVSSHTHAPTCFVQPLAELIKHHSSWLVLISCILQGAPSPATAPLLSPAGPCPLSPVQLTSISCCHQPPTPPCHQQEMQLQGWGTELPALVQEWQKFHLWQNQKSGICSCPKVPSYSVVFPQVLFQGSCVFSLNVSCRAAEKHAQMINFIFLSTWESSHSTNFPHFQHNWILVGGSCNSGFSSTPLSESIILGRIISSGASEKLNNILEWNTHLLCACFPSK